jgi:tRNA A37 threonylcarbamoyladenosine modification protein TsaB
MNIESLIDAAKEIDALAIKQEKRSEAFQQLAIDARNGLNYKEVQRRKNELDPSKVIDFGNAIRRLRNAL